MQEGGKNLYIHLLCVITICFAVFILSINQIIPMAKPVTPSKATIQETISAATKVSISTSNNTQFDYEGMSLDTSPQV
jgi:hypothetical protein